VISKVYFLITPPNPKPEFIQSTGVSYDPIIRLHTISIQGNVRVLGEATLTTDDSVRILAAFSNSRIKNCIVKTIPRAALRSVIITNLPEIMSEKDLFLILNKVTNNIKRIVIADDPEVHYFVPRKTFFQPRKKFPILKPFKGPRKIHGSCSGYLSDPQ
jgi:hypothetical protein